MALKCFVPTLVVMLLVGLVAQDQELVSQARKLYETADDEGALKVLSEAGATAGTPSQRQAVREYRALCLLALERTPEVEKTIEETIGNINREDPFSDPGPLRRGWDAR